MLWGGSPVTRTHSSSENDGRLIGDNGLVRRALTLLSSRESLTSSEVQLAVQATMQRQEAEPAGGGLTFASGPALASSA